MQPNEASNALDVLACNLVSRPAGAPTILETVPVVRTASHEVEPLVVEFDAASAGSLTACVAAKQCCCEELR